ncbi:choice-of-anchor I family protein [Roseovarius albus]|uniref:choice-of-anchor I family protein n=1 Tax=Roseovarius albus TaxID=1247867 RepID=UPI00117A5C7F|nr:choice-of-anchor I family protein [Roseovarius albus]
MAYTLELLHIADQEAGSAAVVDAPNLSAVLNALRGQDIGNDGEADNTLTLSSGDAIIPGLFFDASATAFGSAGIADIQIQNELGISAIALGNHEFDFGTQVLADLIDGSAAGDFSSLSGTDLDGLDFSGAHFTYLSANLDFSTDADLAPMEVAGGGAPVTNAVTSSVVMEQGGELIGVVGATTPTLATISSPDGVGISPSPFDGNPTPEQLDALAAEIQAEVDALLAANSTMNKVVLLAHMQQLDIELGLAERLENVDIILAGGSNTRLTDENDRLRDGDVSQGEYPQFVTNAGGTETVVVNTDGSYKYVGRLVIDFDDEGNIIPESYDSDVSGAYATDAQGVADLGAEGLVDPEIQAIADAIEDVIIATEGNVFGVSDVFLNGNRSGTGDSEDTDGVRTQETNLGNLTADANLAAAKEHDESILVSIKNGGGIRASIGETVVPAGGTEAIRTVNSEVVDGEGNVIKPEGGISQNDIQTTLAFNNNLTLLTLTKQELVNVIEHGLGGLPGVSGRFLQVSGLKIAFDETQPVGDRLVNAAIVDEDGGIIAQLVSNGEIVGDTAETFRIVTLGFLAGGGDGYPFPDGETANRVDLDDLDADGESDGSTTGVATFADDGTEQDALAEYLAANFGDAENAYNEEDSGAANDQRIVQIEKGGVNFSVNTAVKITNQTVLFSGEDGTPDAGDDEGRAEIVDVEAGRAYVTNDVDDVIDIFDTSSGDLVGTIDLSVINGYAGVQSVSVQNGVVAVAINRQFGGSEDNASGVVGLFDADGTLLNVVSVGNLPDSVKFSADGSKIVVANEGEPGENFDAPGTISIIDISNGAGNATVAAIDFSAFAGMEDELRAQGIRIFPGKTLGEDLEPEVGAFSEDGTTAYVSLQENNAIAVVDVATGEITNLFSAGVQDLSQIATDVNDKDGGYNPSTFDNLVSMRQPDTITAFTANGTNYIVTANEGDSRDEDFRVKDFLDGEAFYDIDGDGEEELVTIDASVDTTGLERLEISAIDGDTDGDGDIDVLHAFGGRSFSIFDEEGNLIFDSGSDFARITADLNSEGFVEGRSDNKGTEPEAVTVGEADGRTYVFIGLERDSGIMVYDVTAPENSVFVEYFAPGDVGVSPEGMAFVPAEESPSGQPQLVVSYEVDGSTIVYDLEFGLNTPILGTNESETLKGTKQDDVIEAFGGDDIVRGRQGDDELNGGSGNDNLRGNQGEDTLNGGDGDDNLRGNRDDDVLNGEDGNDQLRGNQGNDQLFGDAGNDTLRGGQGDDELTDGAGRDFLVGNQGQDTFIFVADGEFDQIGGFENGKDLIDVTQWGATSFDDLTIDYINKHAATVTFEDETLSVRGRNLNEKTFNEADFIFDDALLLA